jgi:hypothetical protein
MKTPLIAGKLNHIQRKKGRDREKDSKIIESNMKVLRIDYTITDEVLEYVLDHIF